MITRLYPQKFNLQTGGWQVDTTGGVVTRLVELTLVTFNVWFDDYYALERCEALLEIIKQCRADIICLQEIKPRYLRYILEREWVRAEYSVSDSTGRTIQPYGVVLLSRRPLLQLQLYSLPSVMARKLLVATLEINRQQIQIATVHLESMAMSAPARRQQLAQIFPILGQADHAVLMGDFNFCASWPEENNNLDPAYQDMWAVLRGDEPGYTEDSYINLMHFEKTRKHKQVRFDRILLRSAVPGWQPISIDLLGTQPISANYPRVFPSDHFGLVGKLAWHK